MRNPLIALALLACSSYAAAAERIISLAPNLTELVCAVGACDQLVGVDTRSDYPPQAAKIEKIGDAFQFNIEKIVSLKPDLVLAWTTGTDPQRIQKLAHLGLKVKWIRAGSLDEIGDALTQVGQLISPKAQQQAATAAEQYRARLKTLRQRHQQSKVLGVLYQIDVQPIYTVNARSPISEAISLCGGRNIFSDLSQIAGIVGIESVAARNPDVILYPDEINSTAVRALWKRWPMIKAVNQDALFVIHDSLLARASPRMLDGIEQLCVTLDQVRQRSIKDPRSAAPASQKMPLRQ